MSWPQIAVFVAVGIVLGVLAHRWWLAGQPMILPRMRRKRSAPRGRYRRVEWPPNYHGPAM